jgi:hypothetical protein
VAKHGITSTTVTQYRTCREESRVRAEYLDDSCEVLAGRTGSMLLSQNHSSSVFAQTFFLKVSFST